MNEEHPNGVLHKLRELQQVAFHLRERMSVDNWRALNSLLEDRPSSEEQDVGEALQWLDRVASRLMTLSGFALDGMTRDHAFEAHCP